MRIAQNSAPDACHLLCPFFNVVVPVVISFLPLDILVFRHFPILGAIERASMRLQLLARGIPDSFFATGRTKE